MEVFEHVSTLRKRLDELKQIGKTIGFVPTMGALHAGHLSLVSSSKQDNDLTVVSIFVNPTQFNNKNDLKNYPRTIEHDKQLLEANHADILFYPFEQEMYPNEVNEQWDFGTLDKVMEGKHRPGHFNGVAIIVKKLFEIVQPDRAYFGLKDFQQLAIIQALTKRLQLPITIVPCPIVRESDGLAMSSRNALLTDLERMHAASISKILFDAKRDSRQLSVKNLEKTVTDAINNIPFLKVEYFEIVDTVDLQPISDWSENKEKIGCVAVYVGNVRLIDNIILT